MITSSSDDRQESSDWQSGFTALLPEIEHRLRQEFRQQRAEARDDATEDGVLHCLLSYLRLHERGRADSVTASSLVWYAAKQVRNGRHVGCRLNSNEPLSRYAQRRRNIRVEQLNRDDPRDRVWIDALAHDRRSSVHDQVAARLDVAAWLATLCRRNRQIAADLAQGGTTAEVAAKYGVTAGRISQLRRELKSSWGEFQQEPVFAKDKC